MNHLPQTQLDALLAAAKKESLAEWLMIRVASNHGLRVSEVVQMRGTQVCGGRLYVPRLKGSLATDQPLLEDEREALVRHAAACGDALMFPMDRTTAWRKIKRLMKRVGIVSAKPRTFSFHSLKHSTGKIAADNGMQLPKLQRWMGHKSLNSTAAYTKATDDEAFAAYVGCR